MARFKKHSAAAKAWGRRMARLRKPKRERPRHSKERIGLRHRVKSFFSGFRKIRSSRTHYTIHRGKISLTSAIPGLLFISYGVMSLVGLVQGAATTSDENTPVNPYIYFVGINNTQSGQVVLINLTGFTHGGAVTLVSNDPENSPPISTQYAIANVNNNGATQVMLNEGFGPADTIVYYFIDVTTGIQSNSISVYLPAYSQSQAPTGTGSSSSSSSGILAPTTTQPTLPTEIDPLNIIGTTITANPGAPGKILNDGSILAQTPNQTATVTAYIGQLTTSNMGTEDGSPILPTSDIGANTYFYVYLLSNGQYLLGGSNNTVLGSIYFINVNPFSNS